MDPASEQPELVRRARDGDVASFEALVRAHERRIFCAAYLVTGDHHAAEDLAQEVFMRAHASLKSLEDVHRFSAWLSSIAHNTRTDWVRRRVARPNGHAKPLPDGGDADPAARGKSPSERLATGEARGAVASAVTDLPDGLRHVVVLRYVEGLSYVQIAGMLDISPSSVGERLHRARKKLSEALAGLAADSGRIGGAA